MFDSNIPDDAGDLDFMRALLRACLESLNESDEDSFLNRPDPTCDIADSPDAERFNTPVQNARRRVRRLITEGLSKNGEPPLATATDTSTGVVRMSASSCLSCQQCYNNYNSLSSPDYHNYTKLQTCLRCPCY